MSERIEDYKEYRLRVKACQDCNEVVDPKTGEKNKDVEHTGKVKSVPAYFNADKCEVLVVGYQPEEADHKRQQVVPYSGEAGKAIAEAMKKAHLTGDNRIGFSTIIKCKLANGRAKKRCAKMCAAKHLAWEIEFLKPRIIILMGKEAIQMFAPEMWNERGMIMLEGTSVCLIDQWYVFAVDPEELLKTKSFKTDAKVGERIGFQLTFKKLKELL